MTGHSSVYPPDFNRDSIQCLLFYCVPERNSRHYEVKKTKAIYRCLFYVFDREGKQCFVLLIDFEASCEASAILEESA